MLLVHIQGVVGSADGVLVPFFGGSCSHSSGSLYMKVTG